MRPSVLVSFFIILIMFTFNTYAHEPMSQPAAMIYYHRSIGSPSNKKTINTIGVRFGSAILKPKEINIQSNNAIISPALFDFTFNLRGVSAIKLNGVELYDPATVRHAVAVSVRTGFVNWWYVAGGAVGVALVFNVIHIHR